MPVFHWRILPFVVGIVAGLGLAIAWPRLGPLATCLQDVAQNEFPIKTGTEGDDEEMTPEEALAYPFPADCPSGAGTTVGTATREDWKWAHDRGLREAQAVLDAPLDVFMSVKNQLAATLDARSEFELAAYVAFEYAKWLSERNDQQTS